MGSDLDVYKNISLFSKPKFLFPMWEEIYEQLAFTAVNLKLSTFQGS